MKLIKVGQLENFFFLLPSGKGRKLCANNTVCLILAKCGQALLCQLKQNKIPCVYSALNPQESQSTRNTPKTLHPMQSHSAAQGHNGAVVQLQEEMPEEGRKLRIIQYIQI